MLTLTPDHPLVAYGVPEGHTLAVTVDGDPVEFAVGHPGGPFTDDDADGEIVDGASHSFDAGVSLRTTGTSTVDVELVAPLMEYGDPAEP